MNYSEEQLERYSRQIILKEIGIEGQSKILKAKVLIIGAGGLGSPAGLYLAAAGVGFLGLSDGDLVSRSNLQRQIAHHDLDISKAKTKSFKEKIKSINPEVKVVEHPHIDQKNIMNIVTKYHFVIDGTDDFITKFLINDSCYFSKTPFSHAGILKFSGQTMTVLPGSACYRCVFIKPPSAKAIPTCSEAGILGSVAGILGCIQATEALKYLAGIGELLTNRLWKLNALNMKSREIKINKNPNCPLCGDFPSITMKNFMG